MAVATKTEKPKRSRKTKAEDVPQVTGEPTEGEQAAEVYPQDVADSVAEAVESIEPESVEPLSEEQLANLAEAREAMKRQDRDEKSRAKADFRAVVKSKAFAWAVAVAARGVSGRSTQPVQNNVYLQTQDAGAVRLVATDLEFIQIEVLLPAEGAGNGALTLPPNVLLPLTKSLPECDMALSGEATDTPAKGRLFSHDSAVSGIAAALTRLNLRGMDAKDFEMLPPIPTDAVAFEVQQGLLKQVLSQVCPAVSTDETRPVLTGVCVRLRSWGAEFVATDTHRLAVRTERLNVNPAPAAGEYILPSRILLELQRLLDATSEAPVSVTLCDAQAEFAGLGPNGEVTLGTRIIEGEFPDWQKVVPDRFARRATVQTAELQEALQRVLIIGREDSRRVTFTPTGDGRGLFLSAESADVGDISVQIGAEWDGEPVEVSFNGAYVLDALRGINDVYVDMKLNGPLDPGVFERGDFRYVLMPMAK